MDTKPVIAYCRVSTKKQMDDGLSLDAQSNRLRAWADAKGWPLASLHVETKSGKSADNRPIFQAAIAKAIELKGVFVVCKLDRFARSVPDAVLTAERLNKGGAHLVILDTPIDTTTPYGELMFGMLAVLGAFERSMIAARTQEVMDHKRSLGEALGNVPFGFRREGTMLAPDEREQQVLTAMRSGTGGYRAIARSLNAAGLLSRKNTPWSGGQVRRILLQQEELCSNKSIKLSRPLTNVSSGSPSPKSGSQRIAS